MYSCPLFCLSLQQFTLAMCIIALCARIFGARSNVSGLSGTIPPDGWALPAGLETLTVSNGNLSGPLPKLFQLPSSLKRMDLSSNRINGSLDSIPAWSLPEELTLYLQNNTLSGLPMP